MQIIIYLNTEVLNDSERDEVAFTVINRNKKQVHCDNILLRTNGLNDNCTIVENS